ncbi:MAG TPA: hypothetical protein VII06_41325 [Chloroflexota bacterium]|jgi:hypothetical protein
MPTLTLTLEQALRALGPQLDALAVADACFTIAADGITVETAGPAPPQHHSWDALGEEAAAQKQQRHDVPAPRAELDRVALTHWPVLLRLVGAVLDAENARAGQLGVVRSTADDPTNCGVDWSVEGQTRSLRDEVLFLLLRRRAQYRTPEPVETAAGPPKPSWWRRRWP